LNQYERGIAEALTSLYGYEPQEARSLVIRYIEVIRRLDGYDNCEDHAQRLHLARKTDVSPEEWLTRIQDAERGALRDTGIEFEENRYAQ
jgi:hypothetical protein